MIWAEQCKHRDTSPSPSANGHYTDHQHQSSPGKGAGGLARSNSLRATSSSNWKTLFPSLTRTPSNLQQQNIGAGITIVNSNSCTQTKYQKLKIKIVVFRQLQPGPVLSRVRSSLPRGPGQVLSGVWSQEDRHLNEEEREGEGRHETCGEQLTFVVITQ